MASLSHFIHERARLLAYTHRTLDLPETYRHRIDRSTISTLTCQLWHRQFARTLVKICLRDVLRVRNKQRFQTSQELRQTKLLGGGMPSTPASSTDPRPRATRPSFLASGTTGNISPPPSSPSPRADGARLFLRL